MYRRLFPFFFVVLILSGCSQKILVMEDVLPSAKFEKFEPRFNQTSFEQFELGLAITVSFRNPYDKELQIPKHRMGILLNEQKKPDGLFVEKAVVIPAKSTREVEYVFSLTRQTIQSVLGRENTFKFVTDLDIDLSSFTHFLPNFKLGVTDRFNIDSSSYNPIVRELGQRKLKKYKYHFEKSVKVKIPTLPKIENSPEPIKIEWIGETSAWINPNEYKEKMQSFVDLLIDGKLNNLTSPFVKTLEDASVTIPAPRWDCWTCTQNINFAEHMINMGKTFDPNMEQKYDELKKLVYVSGDVEVADYFVDHFLTKVNRDARVLWDQFEAAWGHFKNLEFPANMPTPKTRGFRISFPIVFRNPNQFPVELPLFRNSAFISGGEPFSIQLRPKNVSEVSMDHISRQQTTVPANSATTLYITFSMNWLDSQMGIYGFLSGKPLQPDMRGVMSYDFGYGPMYVKYSLQDLNMSFGR